MSVDILNMTQYEANNQAISSDDEEALMELHDAMEEYPATIKLIEKRIKELR